MKKQVLLGTTNQAKVNIIREDLESLPIELLSLKDLNINVDVKEDGQSPEENAEKKAKAYFAASDIPTLAINAGLYIEKFSEEKQPRIFVRRIEGTDREVTDEQVLDYYIKELEKVGGESKGFFWVVFVLVVSNEKVFSQSYSLDLTLSSRRSDVLIPGAPLSSLSIDPVTGRYFSEMPYNKRPDSKWIFEFMKQHLETL